MRLRLLAIELGLPALVCLPIVYLARKKLVMIELVTPLLLLSLLFIVLVVNFGELFGEMTTQNRLQQVYLICTVYSLCNMFCSASWLVSLLCRVTLFSSLMASIWVKRWLMGESLTIAVNLVMLLLFSSAFEASLYINMKAKADLFLKMQTNKQQECQLSELLDKVPDSVFICTRGSEATAPKPVYANLNMTKFFGRDIL